MQTFTVPTIKYNLLDAHEKISELEDELQRIENQRDSYLEGLKEYAEAYWWFAQDHLVDDMEKFIDKAVKDYTNPVNRDDTAPDSVRETAYEGV